ncbi:MAG TPA: hypothetical protein VK348_09405 [Planctomycetota bacterium]|nr:hypothetical protein [Planctomycetota bacterium]
MLLAAMPAQEGPSPVVPLRCQVVDQDGRPVAGVAIAAARYCSGHDPELVEARTEGAEGLATFPQWRHGDSGSVELSASIVGAAPHRTVDLGKQSEIARITLPACGIIALDLRFADGSRLPAPLAAATQVQVIATDQVTLGGAAIPQFKLDADGHARIGPVARGHPLRLSVRPGAIGMERTEAALGQDEATRELKWQLPADVVLLHGQVAGLDQATMTSAPLTLTIARSDGTQTGSSGSLGADGSFATVLPGTWIDTSPRIEAKLGTDRSLVLTQRLLVAGANDFGRVQLVLEPVLLTGTLLVDDQPAIAPYPVGCQAPPPLQLPGQNLSASQVFRLPLRLVPLGNGRFEVRGQPGAGGDLQLVVAREWVVDGPTRFAAGTQNVVVKLKHPPAIKLDLMVDDTAHGEPQRLAACLLRQADGREFGTLFAKTPPGTAAVLSAVWPGVPGGGYHLIVRLPATGEVVYEGAQPFTVPSPALVESRTLPSIDLRGRLRTLRLMVAMTPTPPGGWRVLLLRPAGDGPWRQSSVAASSEFTVAGPVDLLVGGNDLWCERQRAVTGEVHLALQAVPATTVRVKPAPPALARKYELMLVAEHDSTVDGEFAAAGMLPGRTSARLGADGTAPLLLNLPGLWRIQLCVVWRGTANKIDDLGPPLEVTVTGPQAGTHDLPCAIDGLEQWR